MSSSQRPWWHRLKWVQASQEEAVAAEQALLACASSTCVRSRVCGLSVELVSEPPSTRPQARARHDV